ncbi:dipeptide/oligopeptide/nickel ABC transporter permease [Natrialba hulunbeirensis JCM 10989]|uniref:Dipeptide/oligopeptide/nickel ABC transporter permease n=1 Tax=Natrialba hulunbeirensis JCM 10989 TaxID=1227493 RepID=M0AFV4_9EURY|nr:ABC transporter permease [Natrialba hulunbeirensis]ELY96233.1 dipeptide/oligopeptide/nickel ABC transporter permease [Natrialba hulunbeirensis JCM 10989]
MATQDKSSIFADIDEGEVDQEDENVDRWRRNLRLWRETLAKQWRMLTDDLMVRLAMITIAFFMIVAVFAPFIAPRGPLTRQYEGDAGIIIADWVEPSFLSSESEYLLGTTAEGFDIFSQLVYGSRAALLVGLVAAVFTAGIGTLVGLTAGYYGGKIDDTLMRIVDFLYGMPLLPTVIILVALMGPSLWNILFAIIVLQWRSTARVIRSQALSLRERPFVKAAQVAGASDWHIISRHLAPNVLPLSFLYGAFAIAWAILAEAGVSFIGLGDPNTVSWGTMLQSSRAYSALDFGAWWWFIPPGICIGLVVISGFLIGRGYEEITNPELR